MKKLIKFFFAAFEEALKRQNKQAYNRLQELKARMIMIGCILRKTGGILLVRVIPDKNGYDVDLWGYKMFDDYEASQINKLVYDILRKKMDTNKANELVTDAKKILEEENWIKAKS